MFIAEREGFEPPVPLSTTVFKTVVIDHSTISPLSGRQALCSKASAKVATFPDISKFFVVFFAFYCVVIYINRHFKLTFPILHNRKSYIAITPLSSRLKLRI